MADTSKNKLLPFYQPDIGPHLKQQTRSIFELYSGIAPENIESHLHKQVSSMYLQLNSSNSSHPFSFAQGPADRMYQYSAIELGPFKSTPASANGYFFSLA